ncbi:MAG: hypothetical protein HGGPFJEG_02382 [Ignavibacteria bacterium]|nr:hypothetical protein [Ignavibacteria bacterium]
MIRPKNICRSTKEIKTKNRTKESSKEKVLVMIKQNFHFCIIFLLIYNSFSCTLQKSKNVNQEDNISIVRQCDTINIIDDLVQKIVMYRDMYAEVPFINTNIDYVLLKDIKPNRKVFNSPYKEKAVYVTDSEFSKAEIQGGTIDIYDITFNIDSTIVNLKTTYYLLFKENAASTSSLKFNFDTVSCQWKLIDSSKVHN